MNALASGFPSKTRFGFATVYTLLGLALLVTAFGVGKGLGWERIIKRPAYCNGTAAFNLCVYKVVESEGAPPGATVTCAPAKAANEYLCAVSAGYAGCYWATVTRSSEGFPLSDTVAQRNKC